jgi:hypothetical protein
MKRTSIVIVGALLLLSGGDNANSETVVLNWEKGHPERSAWTKALLAEVNATLASFDKAIDIASYCPRYRSLDAPNRAYVIATIAVGIAKYESQYDPKLHYGEPPPLGYDSIGLFQLSYEDGFKWCTMDRASKSLEQPIINIQCAVPEMAQLVAADKRIAAGSSKHDARGLARYWSVVRAGPKHHLDDIQKISRALDACR